MYHIQVALNLHPCKIKTISCRDRVDLGHTFVKLLDLYDNGYISNDRLK